MNVFLHCKTKKFLRNLVALFCMIFGLFVHAQTVTIGTGTSTQRYPLGSYYAYEMSASLYTAAEINLPAGGSVQSVAWNCTAAMSFNLPIKIYLKSVPSTTTTFTAQPWTTVKTGAVLVYDGTVSNLPIGWNTVTLQNPYYYNGTDNLQVLVETNFGGTTGGSTSTAGSAITYTTATTKHMYYYGNNVPQGTNGYTSSSRPNIRLTFGAVPTCVPPSGLTLSTLTSTNAGISWTAPATAPAGGYDVYYTTSTAMPTSTTTPSQTEPGTTATLSPLTANTTYYAWVRSKCSGTSQSSWVGPLVIYTAYCLPSAGTSSTTYYLSKILTTGGWTNINYTASSYTAYVNNSSNTLSTSPGSAIGVSLAAGTSTYYYYVWVDWNNDMDFNDTGETILATTSYATTGSTTINVPAAQPYGNYRVRFGMSFSGQVGSCGAAPYGNYVDYTLAVGAPPTCMPPTALVLNSATTSSASIGWTASTTNPALGYEIYYNTTNIAPGPGTVPQITGITGTTATIPGLAANTTYYIWVRAKCSTSDQSPWSGPITVFTNYCAPTGGTSSTTYYLNNVTTTGGWTNLGYTASSYTAYVNSNMSVLSSPGSSVVMNLATSGGSTYYYYVWIDWNNDMDFNDPGETILATTTYAATGTATINIPAGQALGNYRMRCASSFIGAITPCGPAPYGAYVDFTLAVVTPPTCLPPTGMTVTGITGNGATISWATPTTPPALGYAYYVSTTPVQPGTPTGTTTATSVNLTPTLLPNTTYYWWVKAICSPTDNSYVAQGPSFMTTQIPAVLPYLQNFETANDLGLLNGTQTNKWFHGSVTGNTGKSIYISNDNGVTNAYTLNQGSVVQAYRDIMIPAGTSLATFSFDWKAQGESSYDYVRVWLVPATFMPTPGTQITAGTGRVQVGQYNLNGTTWTSYSNANLNLTNFAGTVMRLVFEWRNDTILGAQPPAAIDNIVLRVCSTATPVVTVTPASITHNSATITWPQDIGGASYKIRYRPVGSTQWLPTAGPIDVAAVPGTTQTFTLNAPNNPLTPATLYEVEVAAVCNTINVGTYSHNEFTTKCDPTPPNVTFTNITSTSAVVNWSPIVASATYQMQWRKVGDPGWIGPITLPNPPANTTYLLSGLTPYTQYEVQVRSTCVGSTTPNPWSSLSRFTTERTCEIPPPGLTILELKPTSAKVQWDPYVGPDATGKYILRYRKVGIPGWTNVPVSTNLYTLTGLTELTKYEMQVANVCSGTPGNYTLPYYFTTPTVIYCQMGANTASLGDYISQVTVTPTGKPQMKNPSGASQYTDYTALSTAQIELIQGSANNQLTIDKVASGDAGVVAWIDFDRNGEFDINERILVSGPNTAATATATFSVPSDAFVSNVDYMYVVMRVALMKGGLPVNCTNFDNGEVEDYTVRITKKPTASLLNQTDILIYPNPVSTVLNVKNISKRANYKIYNAAGQLVTKGIILNNKVDVHSLINGVYMIDIEDGSTSVQKKFIKE
ncbi:fibronectin type III domain-containing protein [Chryseobacterium camelliae]|uniref:Fibronectin type III domain-containing protein n=1 Tax=Chryseobacterium camelliae TaxID=1265445 RepID=A0ABY7QSG1_9FLAO|nr:fibronectin type III domain-containing protein [Chryseobacterium camelliae]WBV61887.1 fibronectin type III domain-containing protein [Chryseobacterium camelliae]